MRIDAHQHFWNYSRDASDYGWMGPEMSVLHSDFGPPELAPLLSEIDFSGSVAVQARAREAENDALLQLSDDHEIVKAVVGWLDLCDPAVEARIEHYAEHQAFKGVRMLIHDHPDPEFANSEPHRRGVGLLNKYGLSYDLLLKPPHLTAATRLVDTLPDTRFVVDHIAKPRLAQGWDEEWAAGISAIAERDHVCCKLSGMVTEAHWDRWRDVPYTNYLDFVIEKFGAERLMIGSDWPVALCAADYHAAMNIVIEWASKLSSHEAEAILGRTCQSFYRIEHP
ncbi:amidohydrolase family protein [Pelagibacterium sp.]|uniref:amidohydrolase family protein n=1 Tax=Pelagibacterium sp. TaxID=1967288 RepID=UPI003A957496